MEVDSLDGTVVSGALADAVHEVVRIDEASIEPAPRFGTRLAAEFIKGVGKKDELFIILLDIDRIFNAEDLGHLRRQPRGRKARLRPRSRSSPVSQGHKGRWTGRPVHLFARFPSWGSLLFSLYFATLEAMIDLATLVNKTVPLKFRGAELRLELSHALFSS